MSRRLIDRTTTVRNPYVPMILIVIIGLFFSMAGCTNGDPSKKNVEQAAWNTINNGGVYLPGALQPVSDGRERKDGQGIQDIKVNYSASELLFLFPKNKKPSSSPCKF